MFLMEEIDKLSYSQQPKSGGEDAHQISRQEILNLLKLGNNNNSYSDQANFD
jgi:hypothetical protein